MKIAISLSKEDFLILERLKSQLGLNRSKLVQQAIQYWFQGRKHRALVDKYQRGYRKNPEKISHIACIEKSEYEALSDGGW